MRIQTALGHIFKAAVLVAGFYAVLNWETITSSKNDAKSFAERACITGISDRYKVSGVKPYSIKENSNGFVVRASINLPNGSAAKVFCLTNSHGGVQEITIEQR